MKPPLTISPIGGIVGPKARAQACKKATQYFDDFMGPLAKSICKLTVARIAELVHIGEACNETVDVIKRQVPFGGHLMSRYANKILPVICREVESILAGPRWYVGREYTSFHNTRDYNIFNLVYYPPITIYV
jgi:hypothetical protein